MHGIVGNSGNWDYGGLQKVLPKDVKAEYFAKATRKCIVLSILKDKESENVMVVPKFRSL